MHTNTKLAKSIRLALLFGATSTALSGVAMAQDTDNDENAEKVERIQVTGSRIQRADLEGALPVTVIDREAIELSGETSAADLIRNTTFNSAGSFRPQSGSSAQGVSQVDMRGLGAGRTLVLVDGRRLTMSPSTGSSQDLNSIPMGAIERIEILSDGASAIYGSDAIGGVINIITRRDFNGAEISLGKAEVSVPSKGGDRENGSLVFGSSSDSTSVIGGISWNKRDIVFENAYPWNEFSPSVHSNNWIAVDDDKGYFALPTGCSMPGFMLDDVGTEDEVCFYDTNGEMANEASSSNESLFVKVRHDINNDWTLYSNASVAKTESFGRYAPSLADFGIYIDKDSLSNPTNPNAWYYDPRNPNAVNYQDVMDQFGISGQQDTLHYHRFLGLGNRDGQVSNENVDFLVGAEGRIGEVDLDFGVRRVRNRTFEIGLNYAALASAESFVNAFNPGYCADGSFNPDECLFGYNLADPFNSSEDALNGSKVTTSRISEFNIDEIYASAGFDVVEIGGGMIQGFVGVEHRKDYYSDQYDSQSEAGQVGGSSGNSAGGGRELDAAYFEFLLPVTYDLEVSLAGRYDDYSDYGSDFSPKVGIRYQPINELMLRASWGKGFRAPSLDLLTQKKAYSADSVIHPATSEKKCNDASKQCQITAWRIANPELDSEQSTQIAFGAAYQPTDWLNFSLDYYNIKITNQITFFSSQTLVNYDIEGRPVPDGLGVSYLDDGTIDEILTGYGNEGEMKTSGLDFNARTQFDLGEFGSISNNLQLSHMIDYKIDGSRNYVKDFGLPQQRLHLQNIWSKGDFSVAWNINVIGTQYTTQVQRDTQAVGNAGKEFFDGIVQCDDPGEGINFTRCGNVGTYTTHDIQFNYNAPWDGRFTVGIQNAFEKLPKIGPVDGAQYLTSRDYNMDLYDAYGRISYVRYTQRF